MKAFYQISDENNDGLMDCFLVLSKDYNIPLIGDYRGVQLAVIPFSSDGGKKLAEELARTYCAALDKKTI